MKVPTSHVLSVLEACSVHSVEIMSCRSFGGVPSDLDLLPQGQTMATQHKKGLCLLTMYSSVYNIISSYRKLYALFQTIKKHRTQICLGVFNSFVIEASPNLCPQFAQSMDSYGISL